VSRLLATWSGAVARVVTFVVTFMRRGRPSLSASRYAGAASKRYGVSDAAFRRVLSSAFPRSHRASAPAGEPPPQVPALRTPQRGWRPARAAKWDERQAFASVTSAPDPTRKEVRALLALTDRAVEAVKDIVSSSGEASETGGLRMTAERAGGKATFKLRVVPLPAEDDAVIEEHGARVFVEANAAILLDDKVLDATTDQDQVAFTFVDQSVS
jgi:iron-sulfur cluster assembly protein